MKARSRGTALTFLVTRNFIRAKSKELGLDPREKIVDALLKGDAILPFWDVLVNYTLHHRKEQ